MAQEFVRLAESAPDPRFWSVDKTTRKPVLNKSTGLVRYEEQTRLQPEDVPFTVSAKFDGEERRVTMNRDNKSAKRLAVSMRNLTQQQYQLVTKYLGGINRFLSAVNTSYNPEFLITNAFRDIQSAAINLSGEKIDGIVKGTLKDYRAALVASTKGAFRKGSGEWKTWYDEFTAEGGRVYFNQTEDLDGLKKRIEKEFAKSAARNNGPKMDMLTAKRALSAVKDFVEAANSGIENAVRLSAYKNAREAGLTKAQAASLAKNATVNFNRRGELGPLLNAGYLFFNASAQGTARLLTAMKSPRVRKILVGVVVGGFLVEMMNAMLTGTDDDGEDYYDKIPASDKARNLIVMMPGGKGEHLKIPLPYGYNAFYSTGRAIAEVMRRGGDRWQESGGDLLSAIVDAFNPVGGTNSLLNFISPTVIDPIVDLQQNRDFAERPIMPDQPQYGTPEPDAQRYWGSIAPHWRAITDTLTTLTGGNDIEAGAIDVSPETLEHLSGVVLGATGGFIDRGVSFFEKIALGEEVGSNDVPFLRRALGDKPGWYDKSAYYDRMNQVEQAVSQAKAYEDREDEAGLIDFAGRKENLLSLEEVVKATNKEMRDVRKARRENDFLREMGKIDDVEWKENDVLVKEAESLIVSDFNTVWNMTMYPERDSVEAAR